MRHERQIFNRVETESLTKPRFRGIVPKSTISGVVAQTFTTLIAAHTALMRIMAVPKSISPSEPPATHLHEARDACKRALEMEFYNADYHANLGYVYHKAGLTSTANTSFEEALKWDPEQSVALKYYTGKRRDSAAEEPGLFAGLFSKFKKDNGKAKKHPSRPAKKR